MNQFETITNFETYSINRLGEVKDNRTGKIMPTNLNKDGYKKLILVNPNGKKGFLLHRLIAIQFIPNPMNKPEIDHINREITNNSLDNLRWVNKIEQNENRGVFKNNKLKEKFICYEHSKKYNTSRFRIQITKNYKRIFNKSLKTSQYTLEDAIKIRDDFLNSIN